jgi:hypothetical protein
MSMRRIVTSMATVNASWWLCLACGDSEAGAASGWSSANAIHSIPEPHGEPRVAALAALDHPGLCTLFGNAHDGDPLVLQYLAISLHDVRTGSHILVPRLGDQPGAAVSLVTAHGDGTGTSLWAQSGSVNVAFDSTDGPMTFELDVAIPRYAASPSSCIGSTNGDGEPMETCTCQREDGSSFECVQPDSREHACCLTADPQPTRLQATFTSTPCAAICIETGGFELCEPDR